MRENGAICGFLLSILVFSSFTPFVYAFEGRGAQQAAVVDMGVAQDPLTLQEAECSTSTLTAGEYKRLLSIANESIDFLGDKQAELGAQEKAKRGVKPEVPEAEGRTVMGVDRPIPIKDVVGREPIFQNGTCFLGNAVIRGTFAYASLIDRNYRICVNPGNQKCMAGTLSEEQLKEYIGSIERFSNYVSNLIGTGNKSEADLIAEKGAELEKTVSSPPNYMTTETGFLQTSSADNIFLLPATLITFINWLKGSETWDKWIGYIAIAGIGVGLAGILKGSVFKYFRRPSGPGQAVNWIADSFRRAKDVKIIKDAGLTPVQMGGIISKFGDVKGDIRGIKSIADNIRKVDPDTVDKVFRGTFNEKLKKLEEIRKELEATHLETTQFYKEIVELRSDVIKQGISGVKAIDGVGTKVKTVSFSQAQTFFEDAIDKLTGFPTLQADARRELVNLQRFTSVSEYDAKPAIEGFIAKAKDATLFPAGPGAAATLSGRQITPAEQAIYERIIVKGRDTYAPWLTKDDIYIVEAEGVANIAPRLDKMFEDALEAKSTYEAVSTRVIGAGKPVRNFLGKESYTIPRLGWVVGQDTANAVRKALGSGFTWAAAQTLVLESIMIFTNIQLRKPLLETQGLVFDLNKKNAIRGENPYIQLDVITPFKRGDTLPQNWIVDAFVAYGFESWFPDDAYKQKLKNIGDYIYIHDTASPPRQEEKDAVAWIGEDYGKEYGKRSTIFSRTPGQMLFLAFEHPKNYIGDYTAISLETHDINLLALTDKVTSWALTPFETSMKFLGSTMFPFSALSFFGAFVGEMFGGGAMVTILKGATIAFASAPYIFPTVARESKEFFVGEVVDISKAKDSATPCSKVIGSEWPVKIYKYLMYGTALVSLYPGPVGIITTVGNLALTWINDYQIKDTLRQLHECAETDFSVVAVKKSSPQLVQENLLKDLSKNPGVKSAMDAVGSITPEAAKEVDKIVSSTQEQTLNLRGELGNTVTNVLPERTFYFYLYRAAVDFVKLGPECPANFCSKGATGELRCISVNGTAMMNEKGEKIIEREHVRGFRIDKEMRYAYLPQKVINVNRGEGKKILEVNSSGVTVTNGCLKSEMEKLMGLTSLSPSGKEKALQNSFGRLDVIATREAAIMFDNEKNVLVEFREPACGQQKRSWTVVPGGKIEIYADADGTVRVNGLKERIGQECDLHLPVRDAASFENGLVMPSLDGKAYHAIVYGLVEAQKETLDEFKIAGMCDLDPQTRGIRLYAKFHDADVTNQYNELLNGICVSQIKGQQNETITFEKGANGKDYMNVVDASGKTKRYEVIGYGTQMCRDSMEVNDVDTNVRQCFRGYRDPNGVPMYGFYDKDNRQIGAPIPMFWSNGLGGMMLYDRENGKISIQNEFPFSMNPAFNSLGMMTTPYGTGLVPGLPPNGNPNAGRGTGGAGIQQPNLLASLPWTPEGPELAIFLIAIAGALFFVRVRFPNGQKRKRKP